MTKIVFGNQKTYMNFDDVQKFEKKFNDVDCSSTVICPSYIYISEYKNNSSFLVGAQNVSASKNGATTGEISAEQLKSIGCKYCLVGHSERRKDQNEDSNIILEKIKRLLENGIIPVLCIGESFEEKENDITKDVVGKEIIEVFSNLDKTQIQKIIIAYEPIWSIGSGLIPKTEEIEEMLSYIKDFVMEKYDSSVKVLYGGSVNKDNIQMLNEISVIDGYLIGGASAKADEFLYIMRENSK